MRATRHGFPTRASFAHALLGAIATVGAASSGARGATLPPGIADPGHAGHAVKCQKMLNKGTAKYLGTWAKTYAKCVTALVNCVQTHGSDPVCVGKAVAACNKGIAPLADDTEKDAGSTLENLVTSFCGSLTLSEQLDDPAGMLFSLRADECKNRFGIPSIASGAGSIAFCLFKETNCATESMLLTRMPRARQLLETAGIVTGHAVGPESCLTNVGGGGVLADAKAGKALLKCEGGAATAGVTFAAKARAAFAKCADAVFACAQTKPTQRCLDGATKTCAKQLANVDAAQAKLADGVRKACGSIPLTDLTDAASGDVDGLATVCGTLGVASLATLDDYAECMARQERCHVENSMLFTSPRIVELFTAAGQTFGSAFCP